MTVENLPLWTIRPNWRAPVTERLEWSTAVLRSPTGAEQRFGLRWSPRRSFEATVTPRGPTRTLFDLAVGAVGPDAWYIPVWHDVSRLATTLTATDTTLAIDTVDREFAVGGFVFLRESDFQSEVLEIAALSDTQITFVAGPSRDWPKGTRVYPAVKGRLFDQPSMQRRASRALDGAIRFEVIGANDVTGSWGGAPTYRGLPVVTIAPNEVTDLTHAYEALFDTQDNAIGIAERTRTSDIGFTVQAYNWTAIDRAQHAELRAMFYALAGKQNLAWLPTFADDLYVVAPIGAADTSMEVALCGFTAFGGPRENRQDIQIVLRDGTQIHRRITGSALTGNGTETINLSSAFGQSVPVSQIKRVSFMAVSRLDTDIIELVHLTDARGVMQVSAPFRSAPDIRDADDYTPSEPTNTMKSDGPCGECNPGLVPISYVDFGQGASPQDQEVTDGGSGTFVATQSGGAYFVNSGNSILASHTTGATPWPGLTPTGSNASYAVGLGDGRYVVLTDQMYATFPTPTIVFARTYLEDASLETGPTAIQGDGTFDAGGRVYGACAGDSQTFYALVMARSGGGGFTRTVSLRHFDADHNPVASEDVWDEGADTYYAILPNNSLARFGNTVAIAHSRYYPSGRQQRLVLYFCALDCSVVAGQVEVNDQGGADYDKFIALVTPGDGTVGVVWEHQPGGEGAYATAELRVRFFNEDGTAAGASRLLHAFTDIDGFGDPDWVVSHADITANGNYLVVGAMHFVYDGVSNYTQTPTAFVLRDDGVNWGVVQTFATWGDGYAYNVASSLMDAHLVTRRLTNGEWIVVTARDIGGVWDSGDAPALWAIRCSFVECP